MRMLINIDVPELEAAITFYCAALGLRLKRVIDGDVAELVGAASPIYLLAKAAEPQPDRSQNLTRHYARHWTPVHIDFVVDDIVESTQRAINAGAIQESECVHWKGSTCVTFSDPFGHGFCLIEFKDESYED